MHRFPLCLTLLAYFLDAYLNNLMIKRWRGGGLYTCSVVCWPVRACCQRLASDVICFTWHSWFLTIHLILLTLNTLLVAKGMLLLISEAY